MCVCTALVHFEFLKNAQVKTKTTLHNLRLLLQEKIDRCLILVEGVVVCGHMQQSRSFRLERDILNRIESNR